MNYEEICDRVRTLARQAGEYIAQQRDGFSFDKVEFKGLHDMVSYVDKETEKMVVAGLREIVPQAGFITEEGTAGKCGDQEYKWVIDPLDGTTNFVHGLPPYCVSIALMREERVVVGVIYEVTLREMFYAWEGSPAYLNGRPIRVSQVKSVDKALVAIGFSHSAIANVEQYLDNVAYFQKNSDGIRRTGSAAANIAYVACGRMDAFSQEKLSPWDVAAGALIARQAGARVTDFAGGDNYIFGRQITVANPNLYDEFTSVLK